MAYNKSRDPDLDKNIKVLENNFNKELEIRRTMIGSLNTENLRYNTINIQYIVYTILTITIVSLIFYFFINNVNNTLGNLLVIIIAILLIFIICKYLYERFF
jgi:hypothetical protein